MDANNENIEIIRRRFKDLPHNKTLNNPTKDNVLEHKTDIKDRISVQKFKKMKGMVGKIKVFDQELSDRYDKRSRVIIKSKLGPAVKNNPDKYGEDMIVVTDRIPYEYIELQVYGMWIDDTFPYESPFVYERKLKFRDTTLFICFNASYDKVVMFSRTAIHSKRYRIKKYSREYVHYVPWFKAIILDTDKLSVQYIRQYCGIFDEDIGDMCSVVVSQNEPTRLTDDSMV
jgi:hypothetical protein